VFIFKINTVRPNTNDPFFLNTPLGQQYNVLIEDAKASRPTEGIYGLIGFSRYESPDGLELTSEFRFETGYAKEAFLDNLDVRSITNGLDLFIAARDAYNATVGHVSTVTFEKIIQQ
jgi:hypothetical protein